MSSIGGPSGVGGPKGPGGVDGPHEAGEAGEVAETHEAAASERAQPGEFDRIAADIASGKLTAQQAIDRMVDQIADSQHLGAPERAELREMLAELVANDPYLSSLLNRL